MAAISDYGVAPLLFSALFNILLGLFRFQVFGPEIKADRSFILILTILASGAVFILVFNALVGTGLGVAVVAGLVVASALFIPFQRLSRNLVDRLLPMSSGGEKVPLAERRITYLMALQTAVVKGQITDEEDGASLKVLRRALKVTDREHDLLLESIALHEARRAPKREIQEAYLIFKDGRLLAHHLPTEAGATVEAGGKDSAIVAGMFAAISEYVKEAMKRGKGRKASMDTISYGASSLVIESENNVVLAILLDGVDDLMLRQSMRDTLAEVNERYGKVFADGWDGDMTDMDDLDGYLKALVSRVGRWKK